MGKVSAKRRAGKKREGRKTKGVEKAQHRRLPGSFFNLMKEV
jgi:hypothetical protein